MPSPLDRLSPAEQQIERLAALLWQLAEHDNARPEGDHMTDEMSAAWLLARGVTVGAPSDRTVTEAMRLQALADEFCAFNPAAERVILHNFAGWLAARAESQP